MNARALDLKEVASQISAIWVQMQQQFRTLPFGAKLIFSVAIGGLMLRALGVGFDTSTLILIALALSPWVGVIIEKMKFGEFEVNLKERQEQQQSQIDTAIRFLVKTAVSDYELRHLQGLLQNGTFAVELHDNFQRELRHLLELGLIQRKPGKGFRSLYASPAPHNVKDHFEITDAGRRFLAMRDALFAEEERERQYRVTPQQ